MISDVKTASTFVLKKGKTRFSNAFVNTNGGMLRQPKIVLDGTMTYDNIAVGPTSLGNFELDAGKASIGVTLDVKGVSYEIMRKLDEICKKHVDDMNAAEFRSMLVGTGGNELRFLFEPKRHGDISFNEKILGCKKDKPEEKLTGSQLAPLLTKKVPVKIVAKVLWMCHSRYSTVKLQIRKIFITGDAVDEAEGDESEDEWEAMNM